MMFGGREPKTSETGTTTMTAGQHPGNHSRRRMVAERDCPDVTTLEAEGQHRAWPSTLRGTHPTRPVQISPRGTEGE